jgi:hypothetical protein
MKKLTSYELRQIFAWADNERTLEGFWQRVVIAMQAYPLTTQLNTARLAKMCLDLDTYQG